MPTAKRGNEDNLEKAKAFVGGKERKGEEREKLIESLNNVTFYQQDAVQVTQVATGTW